MPLGLANIALTVHPVYKSWQRRASEAKEYHSQALPDFAIRDANYDDSFLLRHGLKPAPIPPSHRDIVPPTISKQPGEIIDRLVAILTAKYPEWIFYPDSFRTAVGLRAADLANFCRSLWLGIEDRVGVPIVRGMMDQQLAYGGTLIHVRNRLDRWKNLPTRNSGETTREFNERVRDFKARNIPIDIEIPEYNTVYFDNSTDGLQRVLTSARISVFEAAAQFGGWYDSKARQLNIPVVLPEVDPRTGNFVEDEDGNTPDKEYRLTIPAGKEISLVSYWNKTDSTVTYSLESEAVRVEDLDPELPLPFFLALGMMTSSPDPGRMGLPALYHAFEAFERKNGLAAMEWAFLYKHGFARMVRKRRRDNLPGAGEPDLPDQDQEEEEIGELVDLEVSEDLAYITPANVSALFGDAKADVEKEIQDTALADILTGRLPPAGTTGYLMSQLAVAATSKYVPILTQCARALRQATIYILDLFDRELQSEVVVAIQAEERTTSSFAKYKPGSSRGNRNLSVEIAAPLPTDEIARTQWLTMGNQAGYVSRETVQRGGYKLGQPELEDEKIRLEKFEAFYEPIAMLKAAQRAGQMDQVMEAARAGILPPALAQLALAFAAGPEGLTPEGVTGNPSGIIAPQPGLGEPGVPPGGGGGLSGSAEPSYGLAGRAAGAGKRPGGPRAAPNVAEPLRPV